MAKKLTYKNLEQTFIINHYQYYIQDLSEKYIIYKVTFELSGKVEYLVTRRKYIDGKEHGKSESRRKKKKYDADTWPDLIEVPCIDDTEAVYFKEYVDALRYFSIQTANESIISSKKFKDPQTFGGERNLGKAVTGLPTTTEFMPILGDEKYLAPTVDEIIEKAVVPIDEKTKKKIRELEKRIAVLEERYGKFHKVEFMLNHEYEIKKLPKRAPDYVPDDVEFTYGVNNK